MISKKLDVAEYRFSKLNNTKMITIDPNLLAFHQNWSYKLEVPEDDEVFIIDLILTMDLISIEGWGGEYAINSTHYLIMWFTDRGKRGRVI